MQICIEASELPGHNCDLCAQIGGLQGGHSCREEGVAQTRAYALIGIFAHNLESRLEAAMIGNLMSSHS